MNVNQLAIEIREEHKDSISAAYAIQEFVDQQLKVEHDAFYRLKKSLQKIGCLCIRLPPKRRCVHCIRVFRREATGGIVCPCEYCESAGVVCSHG